MEFGIEHVSTEEKLADNDNKRNWTLLKEKYQFGSLYIESAYKIYLVENIIPRIVQVT